MSETWDAVVVGGGPAGLSAALWLARYRRRTLVLDDDRPRNEKAWAVHGFPGLTDPQPEELRRRFREQAIDAGASFQQRRVTGVEGEKGAFRIDDGTGAALVARRVVLCYGRTDRLPDVPGLTELYGSAVFHCADCDGPTIAGSDVGVLGHDRQAAGLALYLLTWARRTVLLTNGLEPELSDEALDVLDRNGVHIRTDPVERLDGIRGRMRGAIIERGIEPLDALFFHWGSKPTSELAREAGCECETDGDIAVDHRTMETSVSGVYAAGDLVGRPHLVIAAAAEGVRAALSIHRSLLPPEFEL